MALSIKDEAADRLARELAAATGETLTDAVTVALRERLDRERSRSRVGIARRLRRLADEVAELEIVDERAADEILGYDDVGLPT
jgi:antitoxin VapB